MLKVMSLKEEMLDWINWNIMYEIEMENGEMVFYIEMEKCLKKLNRMRNERGLRKLKREELFIRQCMVEYRKMNKGCRINFR